MPLQSHFSLNKVGFAGVFVAQAFYPDANPQFDYQICCMGLLHLQKRHQMIKQTNNDRIKRQI